MSMNRRAAIAALIGVPAITLVEAGEAKAVSLKAGDVIVLEHPKLLSQKAIAHITASVERIFPGHKAIVLEEGMRLSIARAATPSDE